MKSEDVIKNPREAAQVIEAADALIEHWQTSFTSPASLGDVYEHLHEMGRLMDRLAYTLAVFNTIVEIEQQDEAR